MSFEELQSVICSQFTSRGDLPQRPGPQLSASLNSLSILSQFSCSSGSCWPKAFTYFLSVFSRRSFTPLRFASDVQAGRVQQLGSCSGSTWDSCHGLIGAYAAYARLPGACVGICVESGREPLALAKHRGFGWRGLLNRLDRLN